VAHVEHAPARFAHDRERLGQEVVEGLALLQPLLELRRPGPQGVVGERDDRRLDGVDALDDRADRLQLPLVLRPDDLGEDGINQGGPPFLARQNSSQESVRSTNGDGLLIEASH